MLCSVLKQLIAIASVCIVYYKYIYIIYKYIYIYMHCPIVQVLPTECSSQEKFAAEADYYWSRHFDTRKVLSGSKQFGGLVRTNGVCTDVLYTHKRATGAEAGAKAAREANIAVSV
jgi:hypothetical protein